MIVTSADNDYSYGFLSGKRYERLHRRLFSITKPLSAAALQRRKEALELYYPEGLERLQGLSRATGVEMSRILSTSPGNPLPAPGCTNFAAVPPATPDNQVYLSWNLDLPASYGFSMGRFPFHVRKIRDYHPYLCLGLPLGVAMGFGFGVMNSEGLCSAMNAVGMTDGGYGLTYFELNNMFMERCSTVCEAIEILKNNPRFVAPGQASNILLNANLLLADAKGDAALVEYSHHHIEVTRASAHEGILASANHHQFIDRAKTGSVTPVDEELIAGSYARLSRMWELLRVYHGSINPRVAQTITSDHTVNYDALREFSIETPWHGERIEDSTICAHPWNLRRHILKGEFAQAYAENMISTSVAGILLEPRLCTLWFHKGHPCRQRYRPYWLGDVLEMPHAPVARDALDYAADPAVSYKTKSSRGLVFTRPLSDTLFTRGARGALVTYFALLDQAIMKLMGRSQSEGSEGLRQHRK